MIFPAGKDWIDAFEALATPIIALLAALFAFRSYRLERRKRDDVLFERRYQLFHRIWVRYRMQAGTPPEINVMFDSEGKPVYLDFQLRDEAIEAMILFDNEVADFVISLEKRMDQYELPYDMKLREIQPPPKWFVEPLMPYLRLGG